MENVCVLGEDVNVKDEIYLNGGKVQLLYGVLLLKIVLYNPGAPAQVYRQLRHWTPDNHVMSEYSIVAHALYHHHSRTLNMTGNIERLSRGGEVTWWYERNCLKSDEAKISFVPCNAQMTHVHTKH